MPTTILPASSSDLRSKQFPTFYCDLGFAGGRESSALLAVPAGAISNPSKWRWTTCQFGEIKSQIETWTKELRMGETIRLVIEAPLSVRFTDQDTGDPKAREIETGLMSGSEPIYPYWYVGAGAQTHLAAMHLIQRLRTLKGVKRILLAEGFVTGKGSKESPTARYKQCQERAGEAWSKTASGRSSKGPMASRHLTDVHILHRILRGEPGVGEIVASTDERLRDCKSILEYIPGGKTKDASLVPPVLFWHA
ncbi:MAG: hypothetical protein RLZZ461_1042 [Planctomycetota bacterium]|jgi:hypothetical protein